MNIYANENKNPMTCYIGHKWAEADIGNHFTRYFECSKCKKRKATQPDNSGYQPVNNEWLNAF